MTPPPRPVLGYWDIRGLGQPIRYLLAYIGVDFEDKRYDITKREEWLADKANLGLGFPNLPYYLDGGVKLTQSLAIMRYLGCKHGLDGDTEPEKQRIDLIERQICDLDNAIVDVSYSPNSDQLKPAYLEKLPAQLRLLSNFVADKPFASGDNISYVDFWMYEYLKKLTAFIPGVLDEFDNLDRFVDRIESLPPVIAYVRTVKPGLFHGLEAKWNAEL